ncbi:hypothetical protein BDZ45DRAFT_703171 [Acephala macrosclerotiorum]|nr:hypothetical protein BDZ45DRAFT_703171 [Acephala macrosclerotiorum]
MSRYLVISQVSPGLQGKLSRTESLLLVFKSDLLQEQRSTDISGNKTDAHGGGIVQRGDTFYWIGQSASDSQVDRNIQALVSTQMVGGYATRGAAVTIPPNSYTYSDTGMFQDANVQITKINSNGSIGARASQLAAGAYEVPEILEVDGRSNPNKMFYSTSITGSWTGAFDIAPQAENTYSSPNTFKLTIKGSKETTCIYMGDSWDSKGGTSSNYIYTRTFSLQYHAMSKVDVSTLVVSCPTTKKRYEAESAIISGRAGMHPYSDDAFTVDSGSQVTFQNVTGTGYPQWISIHYIANNPEAGEAHVFINDESQPTNISLLNSREGYHKVIPVKLTLKLGDVNTITFGAMGSDDFELHIDGIGIFEDEL